ncbi:MAG: exo-alpha-sialidase [Planctomycetales bacterium]|nr:exo-alpha-sialidase [Planctomycetales bacterium]
MRSTLALLAAIVVSLLAHRGVASDEVVAEFDDVAAGPFEELVTPIGRWRREAGTAIIDAAHSKSGRQCLQLSGGELTSVTLELAEGVVAAGDLRFWAERWTSRPPFSFRIDRDTPDGWTEIFNGDAAVRVGRAFLSDVRVPLRDPTIRKLRFRCSSPPDTGILIDDVRIVSLTPQTVRSVEVLPLTLPSLVGVDVAPLAKFAVVVEGQLDPIALAELQFSLGGTIESAEIESVSLLHGGTDGLRDARTVATISRSDIANPRDLAFELPTDVGVLSEGTSVFWIACRLADGADMDHTVGAAVRRVAFSRGAPVLLDAPMSSQRLGIALRRGGDDAVHTHRIPGLATTNSGTLIGVYDVRRRDGGDLPGDIDVGMSRSTDGGRTWEPMRVIMDSGDDPRWHYDGIGDPAVLVDRTTGTIWVAAVWSHGNRGWVGSGQGMTPDETGQLMLVHSDDDGITWSRPINITSQVKRPEWCFLLQGPGKGITMRDGTLVFAAQYQDSPEQGRLPHSTIIYSRDQGATWHCGTGAFDDTTEAQVVELEPGVLMLNCRYNRKSTRVVMTTRDMGATWRKHSTSERALVEPGACMASLINVDQEVGADRGGWLLFSNPDSTNGRSRLTIKASSDRGLTWPAEHRLLLDEGNSAGYSCMTMIDEHTVGILYEGSQAQLTFQRVPLSDVLGNHGASLVSPIQLDEEEEESERPLDIFILTGQSNSLGTVDPHDADDSGPPPSQHDDRVKLFWSNRSTRAGDDTASLIGDSGGMFVPLQPQQGEGANPVFWGPEFGFARALVAAGHTDFAIIKASRGGGGNSFWLKGSHDDHMYRHLLKTVNEAVRVIPNGRRYRIRAILYVQGESDSDAEAMLSGERLSTLLDNLRHDLPYAEEARILVGGIAAAGDRRDTVRREQAAAAASHPGIEYVDHADLVGNLYDGLHFDRQAKVVVGQRLAERWLEITGGTAPHLRLPRVFGSHMVLQADAPLPVWGKAEPDCSVSVTLGAETARTTADGNGDWLVRLPARRATAVPLELVVESGDERISFRDVLIGEVWVCAGQSNMEWRLDQSTNGSGELAELATTGHPAIRLLDLTDGPRGLSGAYSREQLAQLTPETFVDGQWKVATADSARDFSAVGWYFGRHLQSRLDVPIGLICPAVGGSPAEAWIPRDALANDSQLNQLAEEYWLDSLHLGEFCPQRGEQNLLRLMQAGEPIPGDALGPNHPFKPGFLWDAGIAPLIPFAIRGVIWYQGESNAETAERVAQHELLFPLLVNEWRRRWGQGDFPFLFVQLPALNRPEWPAFRDSQRRLLDQLPNTGMAITLDTGHPTDVHPRSKQPVGERLALWALGTTYRTAALPSSAMPTLSTYSGPLPVEVARDGGSVILTFAHAGEGLSSQDDAPLRYFEIAGPDGTFRPALATVTEPSRLVISNPDILEPRQVRYAWHPFPFPPVNFINSDGLPASPFWLEVK